MEWGILAALLLLAPSREPSRAPQLVVLGPCCGRSDHEAEAGA
jgi:hypothetical protein